MHEHKNITYITCICISKCAVHKIVNLQIYSIPSSEFQGVQNVQTKQNSWENARARNFWKTHRDIVAVKWKSANDNDDGGSGARDRCGFRSTTASLPALPARPSRWKPLPPYHVSPARKNGSRWKWKTGPTRSSWAARRAFVFCRAISSWPIEEQRALQTHKCIFSTERINLYFSVWYCAF